MGKERRGREERRWAAAGSSWECLPTKGPRRAQAPEQAQPQGGLREPLPTTQRSLGQGWAGLSLQGPRATVQGGDRRHEEGASQLQTPFPHQRLGASSLRL